MAGCKHSIVAKFGLGLVGEGGVWVPRLLLQSYADLGIRDQELAVILQVLDCHAQGIFDFSPEAIAAYTEANSDEIKAILSALAEKGILEVDPNVESATAGKTISISVEGLYEKLLEIWGCRMAAEYEKKKDKQPAESGTKGSPKVIGNLYRCFEKEFGRPLSPMESTQIMEWFQGDDYSAELILEALKRSVLRGVLNFKYIDSILRGWAKNNVRTVREAAACEEAFSQRKRKGRKAGDEEVPNQDLKKKYEDIYMS